MLEVDAFGGEVVVEKQRMRIGFVRPAKRLRDIVCTASSESVPVTLWVTAPDGKRFGSKEAIIAWIKAQPTGAPGRRQMPQFNLSDQELNDLVAFLKWTSEVNTEKWPPNIYSVRDTARRRTWGI